MRVLFLGALGGFLLSRSVRGPWVAQRRPPSQIPSSRGNRGPRVDALAAHAENQQVLIPHLPHLILTSLPRSPVKWQIWVDAKEAAVSLGSLTSLGSSANGGLHRVWCVGVVPLEGPSRAEGVTSQGARGAMRAQLSQLVWPV